MICRKREAELQIEKALHALGKEEIRQLLEYVREWNTKPKLCHVAQFVLFQLFNIHPPTEIIEVIVFYLFLILFLSLLLSLQVLRDKEINTSQKIGELSVNT